MANTAFDHAPALQVPGSTTTNGLVTWDANDGGGFLSSSVVLSTGRALSNLTSLVVDTITIDGTSITTTASNNPINLTPHGTGAVVITKTSTPTILLTNSTNTNAITINTGTTAANYTITMPTAAPAAGKVLKTTSGSTSQLEWGDAGGSQTPWTGNIDAGNYTLSNVGVAGNSWTANAILMRHSVSGGQISISAYNESNTTNSTAKLRARTGGSSAGDPYMEFEISGGNGQFLMGVDNSASDYFVLGGQGSALGGNDTFRVTSGTPPVLSLNTGLGSNFDYVCSNCGNHGLEMFTCCGEVEWHDDVLALRKAGVDLATMANPYAVGQSLNIAHLVKLGIMDYDDKEEDPVALANRKTPWLGINISNGLMFTWAGMWQTRERMDNQYQELKNTIQELKAEVAALKG